MRSSSALRQQLTRSLGSLAPSQTTRSVSCCQAESYRNGRSAPNQMGSKERKCRCCCCYFMRWATHMLKCFVVFQTKMSSLTRPRPRPSLPSLPSAQEICFFPDFQHCFRFQWQLLFWATSNSYWHKQSSWCFAVPWRDSRNAISANELRLCKCLCNCAGGLISFIFLRLSM